MHLPCWSLTEYERRPLCQEDNLDLKTKCSDKVLPGNKPLCIEHKMVSMSNLIAYHSG